MNTLTLPNVSSRYGAPMGRPDNLPDNPHAPVSLHLERLRMVDGDYDEGGAYWGGPGPAGAMYCAWNEQGVRVYLRAINLELAKRMVARVLTNASFDPASELDEFSRAYITAALWTFDEEAPAGDYEQTGRPDELLEKLAPEALAQMREDCRRFIEANSELLSAVGTMEQHGHDFWLTRNHHGSGFWDREYLTIGEMLTRAAHAFGETSLYRGDDGRIYV